MLREFYEVVRGYDKVIIQTHDNPDADAIASAFGLFYCMQLIGKDSEIIYYGREISKPNLTEMIKQLDINITNKENDFSVKDNELLLIVDCQRGNNNVYNFEARSVACIDHHTYSGDFNYVYADIQPKVGACSTLVVNYVNYLIDIIPRNIATALHFGMFMDTNNFIVKYGELDKEARDVLVKFSDELTVTKLARTTLTFNDIQVCSEAMQNIEKQDDILFSYVGDADDNLLGHMSDLFSEIAGVNIVIIFSERKNGFKLSIRSYHEFISADNIVHALTEKVGSGGGHLNKSGGFVPRDTYEALFEDKPFFQYIKEKTKQFYSNFIFLEVKKDNPLKIFGLDSFVGAFKKPYKVRYINLSDHFPRMEYIEVKTIEGVVNVRCDNLLIIGPKGEIYPIPPELFKTRYRKIADNNLIALCDGHIGMYGITLSGDFNALTINSENITHFNIAETTAQTRVIVRYFDSAIKVRTRWGDVFNRGGSYLIYLSDEEFYLCDDDIFELTYQTTGSVGQAKIPVNQ